MTASWWRNVPQLAQTRIALLSAASILIHLFLRYLIGAPAALADISLYVSVAVGGVPLLWSLGRHLMRLEFGSDLRLRGCLSWPHDLPVEDVKLGDPLVILPHETVPVDGTVVEGHGRMDESYLTGEPFEISKAPGSAVLSGATNNKDQVLVAEASRLPAESRHAQIVRLLEETEANRPHLRRLGDKLAAWYTPVAVTAALSAWLWTGDRAHAFLSVHSMDRCEKRPRPVGGRPNMTDSHVMFGIRFGPLCLRIPFAANARGL